MASNITNNVAMKKKKPNKINTMKLPNFEQIRMNKILSYSVFFSSFLSSPNKIVYACV